jgi:DNA polymerase V
MQAANAACGDPHRQFVMARIKTTGGCHSPMPLLSLPLPCIPLPGCPVLAHPVPAGFPSPATDYCESRLSLDEHLIEHQEATFFVRVKGNSMTGFGIHDGDLLVVDRALDPADRSVVIAVIDGGFTVKQLCRLPKGVLLRAGNPGHGDILVSEDQELSIWGVVRWSIHCV